MKAEFMGPDKILQNEFITQPMSALCFHEHTPVLELRDKFHQRSRGDEMNYIQGYFQFPNVDIPILADFSQCWPSVTAPELFPLKIYYNSFRLAVSHSGL